MFHLYSLALVIGGIITLLKSKTKPAFWFGFAVFVIGCFLEGYVA